MKSIQLIALGAVCSVLSSCALAQSALRIPGSLLKSVGRTAGLNVKNEEPKKTEVQKQEEEAGKIY
jgi:hypothetical protein